jgi:hypothetical protein
VAGFFAAPASWVSTGSNFWHVGFMAGTAVKKMGWVVLSAKGEGGPATTRSSLKPSEAAFFRQLQVVE